ncbi:MAG: sugar ABC transporter permease [Chloroflexota bacterium]|nr:sugar ABC transporter permease [Chloroflexota bacterium]
MAVRASIASRLNLPAGRLARREALVGVLLVMPWFVGFLIFLLGPMLVSVYLSFTDWDLLTPAKFVGLKNYRKMIFEDPLIKQALKVTTIYAFSAVPLRVVGGLLLAVLLNQNIKLKSFIRTVFYLPSVVSGVAVAMLWLWIFNSDFGLLNLILNLFGIPGPAWLSDTRYVLAAFVIMSLWGVGGSMVIYLAGLQGVPTDLYEAAEVDGANSLTRFWYITLPMISPVIFFNLVMSIIAALQIFNQAYIMTQGGPQNASMFMMLYLYFNAFEYFKMGYASALAWLIFFYILALTLLVFRSSSHWVFYTGSVRGK